MMPTTIHVSSDSAADTPFHSINEALLSLPIDSSAPVTIALSPGIYYEKVTVRHPYVTIVGTGTSPADTIIRYDDYANFIMSDGKKRGTFRSYTLFVDAHDVVLRNLTVENASGDSETHGQAIALYADGDRFTADCCRLIGHQDTLFTAPLPPKELQPDGFLGPKQTAPRTMGRHYYKNCYICGDVDFIFGGATAYFEDCTIESLPRKEQEQNDHNTSTNASGGFIHGYVTAASTPEGEEYGYVFSHCRLISNGCPDGSVYLGRPWREYAHTVFLDCSFGPHINPALFHDWNKEAARKTIFYAVNDSSFQERAPFVRLLTPEEADHFSREKVLGGKWD